MRNRAIISCGLVIIMGAIVSAGQPDASDESNEAKRILDATGVMGGVIVQVGCGDSSTGSEAPGRLTAALRANDRYLVHGLDRDAKNVEVARQYIQSLGIYGKAWVEQWTGSRLPYIEDCVNLVVSEDLDGIPMDEVMRVLAPNGVAYIKQDGAWKKTVKPRPKEIDEWTHYLHDPSNNAVAHDTVIAPPTRLQWVGSPRTSRHHDHMSAVNALVSANGRNFCIFDEGPRSSILLPPYWQIEARDAFNGAMLWERPIGAWETTLLPLKSGPAMMPRRLVASGDRVYVTLALDAPLSALDAATGKTILTYEGTAATEEILFMDGMLYLVVADPKHVHGDTGASLANLADVARIKSESWGAAPRTVIAVDAESGAVRWRKSSSVVPMTLAADSQGVYFHDGGKIVCLERETGQQRWASQPVVIRENLVSKSAVALVVQNGVVLFAGGEVAGESARRKGAATPNEGGKGITGRLTGLCAFSTKDGSRLWSASQPITWGGALRDILVVNGLAWSGDVASGSNSGIMTGRDIFTGAVRKQFPPDVDIFWFHHRCYRAKATDNYLLYSRTGIEFIDVASNHWTTNHWVRGGCLYGVMPCNGLVYNPPHPCACYSESKLSGFTAVAPPSKTWHPMRDVPEESRLEQGPVASAQLETRNSKPETDGDWPTYRHDPFRSGAAKSFAPATDLKRVWQAELGGRLSAVTVADGKLFVASIDSHTVHALDEKTGKPLWSFSAGGRVDSPPTIWQGRALFGSVDGYVYCLRASDGHLIWRYRAAPEDRRLGAFEQVESVWPVSGSVLVQGNALYCVAGRSMFLDGGMRMLRLDPATGRKLSETILDDRDPATGKNLQSLVQGLNMPVALPDILSSDGRYVYMRSLPFTMSGERKFVKYVDVQDQQGDDVHLFSPTGFLDNSLWHRTYWVYGRAWASGAGGYHKAGHVAPAGRLLVFDQNTIYGFGRLPQYYKWTTPMEFHLFATSKTPELTRDSVTKISETEASDPEAMADRANEEKAKSRKEKKDAKESRGTRIACNWSEQTPIQVCAMVLAGDTLFVAGPPDVVDEEKAARSLNKPETHKQLAEQEAAMEGRRGALLMAVSRADGKRLASYRLDSMPIFDGMAAARGNLFVSTTDGKVLCLGAGEGQPLQAAPEASVTPRPADKPAVKKAGPKA